MGMEQIDYVDIEFQNAERLLSYDVIYIGGGNPFILLYHMRQRGADKIIIRMEKEDKVIVGVSAGRVILGPDIKIIQWFTPKMNDRPLLDLTGLGITDKMIFPHYDREDLFPNPNGKTVEIRIKEFEQHNKCKIERIKMMSFFIKS